MAIKIKRNYWPLAIFLIIYIAVIAYNQLKPLPEGISYEGDIHAVSDDNIEFIYDLTYQQDGTEQHEHNIQQEVIATIEGAEEFLIIDMFMINESSNEDRNFPPVSSMFANKIREQLELKPDLDVVVITDPLNTTYGSHEAQHIDPLQEAGAEVIYTDLTELRDPTPLYTGIWRMFFQWFGQEGTGWIPNALGPSSPDVTLRSYLKMVNVKANHRKAVISENEGIYMSWNAHDASGYHSDIAVRVRGSVLKDMIEAEKAVAAFSGGNPDAFPSDEDIEQAAADTEGETAGDGETAMLDVQVVTERQIEHAFIEAADEAQEGDELWLGMFYLADRHIIDAVVDAAERGADVRLVLDPNQNAFGQQKIGLPNVPVASELADIDNIDIRWYNTDEEQYHSKIAYIRLGDESHVIAGSTNFTSRNLDNYNLENNFNITGPNDSNFIEDIDTYFNRIWDNEDAQYTLDYEAYEESLSTLKYIIYWGQKIFRVTTY